MKRMLALVLSLALLACPAACGKPAPSDEITFELTVVYPDGSEKAHTLAAKADNLGDALLETGLAQGEVSAYGLMIKTVDGVTADYDKDEAWWKFTIDGEEALQGVSQTTIESAKKYALIYTIGFDAP